MTRWIARLTGMVFVTVALAGTGLADKAPPPPKKDPVPIKKVEPKPAPDEKVEPKPAPAAPTEPAPPQPKPTEPAPSEKVAPEPVPAKPLERAPDGTFTGVLRGATVAGRVEVLVRGGLLIRATVHIEGAKAQTFRMRPTDDRDAVRFGLIASGELDYMRLSGEFLGPERASGTFKGNLDRNKVSGEWYLIRR